MKALVTLLFLIPTWYLTGQVSVDFTDPNTPTYGTNAQKIINVNGEDVTVMWAGDANQDGRVRYSDLFIPPATLYQSDAIAIFNQLGGDPTSQVDDTYSPFDTNLDGKIRYSDFFIPPATFIPSDALFIFNVLEGNPAGQISQQF